MKGVTLPTETVFVMEMSPIKFGLGATDEIGFDARRLGLRKVLIVTDPGIAALGLPERVRAHLDEQGIKADVFDGVEVEPTDRSMEEAADYARTKEVDGFVAVGGGSAIDTGKAVNLLTCYPAPLLDYVNKPVGRGVPVPGPLKPLIAVPTTAGTGSETTAVAVTHVVDAARQGRRFAPPAPPGARRRGPAEHAHRTAGGDRRRGRGHPDPRDRVVHDAALRRTAEAPPAGPAGLHRREPRERHLVREGHRVRGPLSPPRGAERDGRRGPRRTSRSPPTTRASASATRGCTCRTRWRTRSRGSCATTAPPATRARHPLVPHGMSVILTAPAAFRFTYPTSPERHLRAAELLGVPVRDLDEAERAEALPRALVALMRDVGIPNGLAAVGYAEGDATALVEATLRQPRLLANAPRSVGSRDLDAIVRSSMRIW